MKPLICFYRDDLFIVSQSYELLVCSTEMRIADFLNQIQKKYFSQLKIVQANFEFDENSKYEKQKPLYTSDKASVFILHEHELKTLKQIKEFLHISPADVEHSFKPLITEDEFVQKVKTIKGEISKGRIYQVNITAPLTCQTESADIDLFFQYEKKFNSQYKACLPFKTHSLISFSPELFIERKKNRLITRPIKGSSSAKKDFKNELYDNRKEEAELSMIVDLLRNDLNSLDVNHSSVVTKHRAEMQLGYIQHTYSEIAVENDQALATVLEHLMPGGSISGCPKIESLNVIRELETYRRQAYTGTLGWWQENDFSLNLTIRTLIKSNDLLIYHAGCGIVYDSDPKSEWNEFLLKTGSLNIQSNADDFTSDLTSKLKSDVLDTLVFRDKEIYLKNYHIDRSFEAYQLLHPTFSRRQIENIYNHLENSLQNIIQDDELLRLTFSHEQIGEYRYEIIKKMHLAKPVRLEIIETLLNPAGLGLQNYKWDHREAWTQLMKIKSSEADDVIALNTQQQMTETSRCNLFFYDHNQDQVFTPTLDTGCINGVYRRYVLKEKSIDLPGYGKKSVIEKNISVADLLASSKIYSIFVANSARGVLKACLTTKNPAQKN